MRAGEPHLVLGRDQECSIPLPDPERILSRRHLAVWNEAGELHFQVLSVVNGVEMPFGEAPPGARGVLGFGQVLKLGEYSLVAAALADDVTLADDPWAVFGRDPMRSSDGPGSGTATQALPQRGTPEDPFGDWGFETTLGMTTLEAAAPSAPVAAGGLAAFFRGLGLEPGRIGPLSQGELEAIGRLVREAVLGLVELHGPAGPPVQEVRQPTENDSTLPASSDPLKTQCPAEEKLHYLFGGHAASAGFVRPERALQELLGELLAREQAQHAAMRQAMEASLREFSPAALKARLLGSGTRLFESGKAWDAYSRYYGEQAEKLPAWAQSLLDKHFTQAYARESQRINRETPDDLAGQASEGGG